MKSDLQSIDAYIGTFAPEIQALLQQMRTTIQQAAPDATEGISYGMPVFKLHGVLVYFAGHKNHLGFYPMAKTIDNFKEPLANYHTSKGTVQFPYHQPIPFDLVAEMVKTRVQENCNKALLKGVKGRK